MLGGDLDGVKGTFGYCRKKGHRTQRRMFALLAMPRWSAGNSSFSILAAVSRRSPRTRSTALSSPLQVASRR